MWLKISEGKGNGELQERIFKLNKMEKDLYDNFQTVKNNQLLWGKTTIQTEDGRPLISGDGLIAQIERFASKFKYAKLNINIIDKVMEQMTAKAKNATGNQFTFIVNDILWSQINTSLADWLKLWGSTPTMMYSKAAGKTGGKVTIDNAQVVGASFQSYTVNGNTITFMVDRALSKEYDKGYGICLDTTPDVDSNQPAIASFTLAGAEFITSKYPGKTTSYARLVA